MTYTYVSYLRVSTKEQGLHGYGIDAQRASVTRFLAGKGALLKEFIEVESGKYNNRLQLTEALELCKLTKCTLIIAKLDRLSRNASFLIGLQDANVDFVCVDMPDANKLTIGIMALIAQHERETISSRTKAGLEAAKARGVKLGASRGCQTRLTAHDRARGALGMKHKANNFAKSLEPYFQQWINDGHTLQQIADECNNRNFTTSSGITGKWTKTQVARIMARLGQ